MEGSTAGDSKALWLSIREDIAEHDIRWGAASANAYVVDPRMIAFIASRYKFVGKMLAGCGRVLEVGCGDGFGAPLVAQTVSSLTCTDIDEPTLADNRRRLGMFGNLSFGYHDFRAAPHPERFEAAYLVDVIEHIFPVEESGFFGNIAAALPPYGVCLVGTPNANADRYASFHSRAGHVNLKTHEALKALCLSRFHRVFLFSMNDEVVHTGFSPMANYLWALSVGPR